MSIKSKIRTIENYPIEGVMFRDISSLISDSKGLKDTIDLLRKKFIDDDFNYIAGIESRGFILGSALAYSMKKGFVMIRKPGKLPGNVIEEEYQLEYGTDKIEIQSDAFPDKSKILLVDDLIATGGTIIAAISLIERLGGIISSTAFIVDLPDLGGSQKIKDLGYNFFALTEFDGE
tara:strand:- start:3277 stop:3804 length:528 start_codon:yes stop_codon:yes gene_type:complete